VHGAPDLQELRAWDTVGNLGLDDSNGVFYIRRTPIAAKEKYAARLGR